MSEVEKWAGFPASHRVVLLRTTLAGGDGITPAAATAGLPPAAASAALAAITATALVGTEGDLLVAAEGAVALIHALVAEVALASALGEATRRRRSPVTTAEVVQRIVVAVADHGELTYTALSRRHLSARQRPVLDEALEAAIASGAVRWVAGRRLAAGDINAVGVSSADVEEARRRRAVRSQEFASEEEVEG